MSRLASIGSTFNSTFEKYMFVIIPSSMVAGYFSASWLAPFTSWIAWLFAWVTFVMAMGCSVKQLTETVRKPRMMIMLMVLAHLVAPTLVYWLGRLTLGADSPYLIGLVLFTAIPLGVSSIIWVGMSGGLLAFTLAVVVIDTLLSPLVIPAVMQLFFGAQLTFDYWQLFRDLSWMIVLPTIAGVMVNHRTKAEWRARLQPYTAPTAKIAFMLVVMINVAVITPLIGEWSNDLLKLVPLTLLVVGCCYLLGFVACFLLGSKSLSFTVTYLAGMRNISLGIVVGLPYFGPLAAVPVVLSILIQQPMATLNHWLLHRLYKTGHD